MSDPSARMVKRSVTLAGHRTSVALEQAFWDEIDQLAKRRELPLARLINEADQAREPDQNLASALRMIALRAAKIRD